MSLSESRFTRRKFLELGGVALGAAAVLPVIEACGIGSSSTPGGVQTLKVGTMIAQSGASAAWGLAHLQGVRVWADMVNDGSASKYVPNVASSGGIVVGNTTYKIQLDSYDTQHDPTQATTVANKLISDGVTIVMGPDDESEVMASINKTFNAHGVMHIETSSLWYDLSKTTPIAFNFMSDLEDYYSAQALWISEGHPEIKKVALLGIDWPVNRLGNVVMKYRSKKSGTFQIVYEGLAPQNTLDFSPIVTAAVRQNPDLIDMGGMPDPTQRVSIMQSAYQQGFRGKYASTSFLKDLILQKVPASAFKGSIESYPLLVWDVINAPTDEAKWFVSQFASRVGLSQFNLQSPKGYYMGRILCQAIAKANSVDGKLVGDALRSMPTVETGMGVGAISSELAGTPNVVIPPQHILEVDDNGDAKLVKTYAAPFNWDHNWQGIAGADEFKKNP